MHYLGKNELHHIAGGMTQEEAMKFANDIEKAIDSGLPWAFDNGKDKWKFK